MLIYNITTSVENSAHAGWLQWMLDEHIPEILGSGVFDKHVLVRLLDVDETEGVTYALQLYVASRGSYDQYQEQYGNRLRQKTTEKWGDRIYSFRTLMQVIEA